MKSEVVQGGDVKRAPLVVRTLGCYLLEGRGIGYLQVESLRISCPGEVARLVRSAEFATRASESVAASSRHREARRETCQLCKSVIMLLDVL